MGKLFVRHELTPSQFHRANKVMMVILILCYITYIVVDYINQSDPNATAGFELRCGLYLLSIVLSVVMYAKASTKRMCMLFYAINFLITYSVLIFCNGPVTMVLVFPALLGFLTYLNSVVVVLGIVSTTIICSIKTTLVFMYNGSQLGGYAILIFASFFVAIYGSIRTVLMLIEFSKEDRAAIKEEADNRAKVAQVVADIVQKIDTDFREMLQDLNLVNDAMGSANNVINDISHSSESTTVAVETQVSNTNKIQENLEVTNQLSYNAADLTKTLESVVSNGKVLSDELQQQSNLVDKNIADISATVGELVSNVQKVHGITESILNISSQTNLLALNASIEAARAGNAGRGFAVVADEIRKLAEETKVSTEQITAINNELTSVTTKTQAGIMESTNSINQQLQKVREVNHSFAEVEKGMIALQNSVHEIEANVESVLLANTEIVNSIQCLSDTSSDVSAGALTCRYTFSIAFENLDKFSHNVNDTFEQLQVLRETTQSE